MRLALRSIPLALALALRLTPLALALALCACATSGVAAPTPVGLHIDGDVPARTLTLAELEQLGPGEVPWKHGDQAHTYHAVPLDVVLRLVGVEPGAAGPDVAPSAKRAGWKFAVVVTASDGYQATFSVAELFRGMGPTEAYLALGEDGKPLDVRDGPLRLVVPTDGEGARSVRNVERLTVLDLRRRVPAKGASAGERTPTWRGS